LSIFLVLSYTKKIWAEKICSSQVWTKMYQGYQSFTRWFKRTFSTLYPTVVWLASSTLQIL